jgi:hypothetical protein
VNATLTKKSRFGRVLSVTIPDGDFTVEYNGYGIGYESVLVNGQVAAKRSGWGKMSHRYEFRIGSSKAALTVAIPRWCEVIPVCNLSAFALEIDGEVVYAERNS